MNSKEFLALIETAPLPWEQRIHTSSAAAGPMLCYHSALGNPVWPIDPADKELPDAAPAMAAAIIRLLNTYNTEEKSTLEEHMKWMARYRMDMEALRASLPESLRP